MSSESRDLASTDAAPMPFAMIEGDPNAFLCEGDACLIPSAEAALPVDSAE